MTLAALILAGGAGERLVTASIVPRFMKPLRKIDGVPLVARSARFALEAQVDHVVIVTNPANDAAIRDVINPILVPHVSVTTTIQSKPIGIVDAIRQGLRCLEEDRVVLLCADNTFEPNGEYLRRRIEAYPNEALIAVTALADPLGRLTWIDNGKLQPRVPDKATRWRWVGPVVVSFENLREAIEALDVPIETVLNDAGAPFRMVQMSCRDHGVIE